VPDLEISRLPALAGANLQGTDPLALADLSASETKQITAKDLIQHGVALIDDGSIPATKLSSTALPDGSVTEPKLADEAVSARTLADNSSAVVGASLPATGHYVGQLAYNTADNKTYIWTGAAWAPLKAAGSVNSITGDTTGPVLLTVTANGDGAALDVSLSASLAAGQFLAGPSTSTGAVTLRRIEALDLPLATATDRGAVIVNGGGLKVAAGTVSLDNAVAASVTYGVVTYDAYGLVTAGRALLGADLPLATTTSVGAIRPGGELTVDSTGVLSHTNRITPGTGTRLDYDAYGHITGSSSLRDVDIPSLDAAKIISGTFGTDRLADRSVTAIKLADYATAYIQDVQPPNAGNTIGQLWLNPLAQQIRMWDGNVWVPIGVGALSEQNLRFCGLFDASSGQIKILTQFGRDAGYKVGDVLPVATDQLTGSYFVCETAGNGTAVTAGVAYDPGDWCVCLGVAQGWARVDTLSGAGGGGGASTLDGLIDVDAPAPAAGQFLGWDGTVWKSLVIPVATTTVRGIVQLADAAAIAAGTTGRVVTADQLKATNDSITVIQGQTIDASETAKGIIELATAAEVLAGTDAVRAVTPKGLKDHYLAKNIALLPALP